MFLKGDLKIKKKHFDRSLSVWASREDTTRGAEKRRSPRDNISFLNP